MRQLWPALLFLSTIILCGCSSSKPVKAIRNSTLAYSDVRPINLVVTETARLGPLLELYQELCKQGQVAPLSQRLQETLIGQDFTRDLSGVSGSFKKTYRNPFEIVSDAEQADMELVIYIEEIYFTQEEVSKLEQSLRAVFSGLLIQPKTFPENFMKIECRLQDKAISRTVYQFTVYVRQEKTLFGKANFAYLMSTTFEELLNKLLDH